MRAGARTLRRRPRGRRASCGRARPPRCRPCDSARPAQPGSAASPDRCRRRCSWHTRSGISRRSARRAPGAHRGRRRGRPRSRRTRRGRRCRAARVRRADARAGMKRSPLVVDQRRAFAAQRFGRERRRIAADHDRGRVELHEFGIGDHGAGARGDRKAEAAGLGRVGRDGIEMADAAGREHHRARGDDHAASPRSCRPRAIAGR